MIKLLLSVLLIALTTLLGYSSSLKLRIRRTGLQKFIECIHRMKPLICFSGYDIERLIKTSFNGVCGFEDFSLDTNNEDLYGKWKECTKCFVKDSKLKDCDEAVILRFGESLGITDAEGQIMNCDLYTELLCELFEDAKYEEKMKTRLFRVLGFSLGSLVTLLIL